MQAGAVVIAVQFVAGKGELAERVRSVNYGFDAPGPRHLTDTLHGEDLSSEICDVANMNYLRLGRNGPLDAIIKVVEFSHWHRKRNLLQHDAFPAGALAPRRQHAPIVLIRREDFVAGLQIHPQLHRLERFAGIAGDGDLFGVAAKGLREPTAHYFQFRPQNAPHIVSGTHVGDLKISFLSLHHHLGRRTYAAVVEVDHVAVDGKGVANVQPEVLIAGHGVGGLAPGALSGSVSLRNSGVLKGGGKRGRRGE